jgi:coenzyme F420-0:L-glutamate ligase/coenzyme F420-1:gamma-L-glutamate ligase
MSRASLRFEAAEGFPEVRAGDDLAALVIEALRRASEPLAERDVVIVAQKIVSKSERRLVRLTDVTPGDRARELAAVCRKDPRLVELVLRESTDVVRCVKDILIVRHRLGFVVANAGVDQSNVEGDGALALLLPIDPDASAARLRDAIAHAMGVRIGVVVSDSFGRPWRMGVTGTCIGCAGIASLVDQRGRTDRFGRALQVTQIAAGDAIAAAAVLAMGEADEGRPLVIARGLPAEWLQDGIPAQRLVRAPSEDLFR